MIRLAILIDADNISSKTMESIMLHVASLGDAAIRRIYGDWSHPQLASWKPVVLEYAFLPMQQYRYAIGKNATDAALIIDAMDLLYANQVDGFCLVSSDSDFTRLALRLREAGKTVIGIGNSQAPQAYRATCTKFILLDKGLSLQEEATSISNAGYAVASKKKLISKKTGRQKREITEEITTQQVEEVASVEPNSLMNLNNGKYSDEKEEFVMLMREFIAKLAGDDGWANLSQIGAELHKAKHNYSWRHLGRKKLIEQIRLFPCFEIVLRKETKVPLHFVRYIDQSDEPLIKALSDA